jgi:hypothetical protein
MRLLRRFLQWLAERRSGKSPPKEEQVVLTAFDGFVDSPDPVLDEGVVGADRPAVKLDQEIDFSRVDDLESYTENLNVPTEDIEAWISAGLLYPDEIRTAERMIQILRKKGAPTKTPQR